MPADGPRADVAPAFRSALYEQVRKRGGILQRPRQHPPIGIQAQQLDSRPWIQRRLPQPSRRNLCDQQSLPSCGAHVPGQVKCRFTRGIAG